MPDAPTPAVLPVTCPRCGEAVRAVRGRGVAQARPATVDRVCRLGDDAPRFAGLILYH